MKQKIQNEFWIQSQAEFSFFPDHFILAEWFSPELEVFSSKVFRSHLFVSYIPKPFFLISLSLSFDSNLFIFDSPTTDNFSTIFSNTCMLTYYWQLIFDESEKVKKVAQKVFVEQFLENPRVGKRCCQIRPIIQSQKNTMTQINQSMIFFVKYYKPFAKVFCQLFSKYN